MTDEEEAGRGVGAGRQNRRRQRTRDALITAAQTLLAEGADTSTPIQTITDRADVGFGSFYNHFSDRAELFTVARAAAFDRYRSWLHDRTADETDPIRRLAARIRLTGRLPALDSDLAAVLVHRITVSTPPALDLTTGLAADLQAGVETTGRGDDIALLPAAAGAIEAVIRVAAGRPAGEQARMADALAQAVLRMIGVDDETIAHALVSLPDPQLPT